MLVSLYLHHRYQLEAAAKWIGGVDYTYAVKEKGAIVPQPVRQLLPPAKQREAMRLIVSTLEPSFLEIPKRVIDLIPPRGSGGREMTNTELFEHRTAPVFDPISAATSSADITLSALFDPRRAARLAMNHAEDASQPAFNEVIDDVVEVGTRRASGMPGALTRATARV